MTINRNLSILAGGVSSTGVLGVPNGGSGATSLTGYLIGNGAGAFTASATIPTSALSGTVSLTTQVSGILPIANGGTAQSSFTTGYVHFGSFSTDSNFFWDNTNKRLGLGTTTPSLTLNVKSPSDYRVALFETASTAGPSVQIKGSKIYELRSTNTGAGEGAGLFFIYDKDNEVSRITVFSTGGVSIGNTTDPGAGNLRFTTAGTNGIYFGSSARLDDYQTGTWTPTGVGVTFASASGKYVKIGKAVYISFSITWPVNSAGNQAGFSSFPFASDGTPYAYTKGKSTYTLTMNIASPGYAGTASGALLYNNGDTAITDAAMSTLTLSGSGFYFTS